MAGRVQVTVTDDVGAVIPVRTLQHGDYLGQGALIREAVTADATALEEVLVLQIDRDDIEELVMHKPVLLKELGKAIEERRQKVQSALESARGN